jgi:hypothetical protein
MAADDHFILIELSLEALSQCGPPFPIDGFGHDFDDSDIVVFCCWSVFPPAFGRCAREACHAAEFFSQRARQALEGLRGKSSSLIVIEWQQDLNEMHGNKLDVPNNRQP